MFSFILSLLLFTANAPHPLLCNGIKVDEWEGEVDAQQYIEAQILCEESVNEFPQWISPIRSITPKAMDWKISFLSTQHLTSKEGKVRYGWTDYIHHKIFVTNDSTMMIDTLPHEIYHALSHQYGVWKLYGLQDEEVMADRYAEYIGSL